MTQTVGGGAIAAPAERRKIVQICAIQPSADAGAYLWALCNDGAVFHNMNGYWCRRDVPDIPQDEK